MRMYSSQYRAREVGRFVPMQSRTLDKTYPKIGTPDSFPAFEVAHQVVPMTGRIRDK